MNPNILHRTASVPNISDLSVHAEFSADEEEATHSQPETSDDAGGFQAVDKNRKQRSK